MRDVFSLSPFPDFFAQVGDKPVEFFVRGWHCLGYSIDNASTDKASHNELAATSQVSLKRVLIEREDGFGYQALTEFTENFYAS